MGCDILRPKVVSSQLWLAAMTAFVRLTTKPSMWLSAALKNTPKPALATDKSETTGKLVAAKFEHQTARPVDGYSAPQLHTHVVIFNMTRRADGKFNALQTESLFDSQQYATAVYQAELTYRLRNLGYELRPGKAALQRFADILRNILRRQSAAAADRPVPPGKRSVWSRRRPRLPPTAPATANR